MLDVRLYPHPLVELDLALQAILRLAPERVQAAVSDQSWDTGDPIGSRTAYLTELARLWQESAAELIGPQALTTTTTGAIQAVPNAHERRAMAYVQALYQEEVATVRQLREQLRAEEVQRNQWRTRATDAEAMVANYRQQLVGISTTLNDFGTTAGQTIQDPAQLAAFLERIRTLRSVIDGQVNAQNTRDNAQARERLEMDARLQGPTTPPPAPRRRGRAQPAPAGGDPEEVARLLLTSYLTPSQLAEFEAHRWFTVTVTSGVHAGEKFLVSNIHSQGVYPLILDAHTGQYEREEHSDWCLVPSGREGDWPPICDHMLAEKLLLENDPDRFFSVAIPHGGAEGRELTRHAVARL
jgi:hypothetical protein